MDLIASAAAARSSALTNVCTLSFRVHPLASDVSHASFGCLPVCVPPVEAASAASPAAFADTTVFSSSSVFSPASFRQFLLRQSAPADRDRILAIADALLPSAFPHCARPQAVADDPAMDDVWMASAPGSADGRPTLHRGSSMAGPGASGFEIHIGGARVSGFTLATRFAVSSTSTPPSLASVAGTVLRAAGVPSAQAQKWGASVPVAASCPRMVCELTDHLALGVYSLQTPAHATSAASPASPSSSLDAPFVVRDYFTLMPAPGTTPEDFYPAAAALLSAVFPSSLDVMARPPQRLALANGAIDALRLLPPPALVAAHSAALPGTRPAGSIARRHIAWATLPGLPVPPGVTLDDVRAALAPLPSDSPLAMVGSPSGDVMRTTLSNILGLVYHPTVVAQMLDASSVQWTRLAKHSPIRVSPAQLPRLAPPDTLNGLPGMAESIETASAALLATDPHEAMAADLIDTLIGHRDTTWTLVVSPSGEARLDVTASLRAISQAVMAPMRGTATARTRTDGRFSASRSALASRRSTWTARAALQGHRDEACVLIPPAASARSDAASPSPSAIYDALLGACARVSAPYIPPKHAEVPALRVPVYTPPEVLSRGFVRPVEPTEDISREWATVYRQGGRGPHTPLVSGSLVFALRELEKAAPKLTRRSPLRAEALEDTRRFAPPSIFQRDTVPVWETAVHAASPAIHPQAGFREDAERPSVLHDILEQHYGPLGVDWQVIYDKACTTLGDHRLLHDRWASDPDNVPTAARPKLRTLTLTRDQWESAVILDAYNGVIFPTLDPNGTKPERISAGLDVLLSLFIRIVD